MNHSPAESASTPEPRPASSGPEPVPVRVRSQEAPVPPPRAIVMPPIDIYETEEGLVLVADLPGVSPPTLELQVQDNRLTLLGRVATYPGEPGTARHEEFEQADYLRSFILSEEVDHDRISAKLVNGVLEVRLPRTPKSPPRRIQVTAQ